MMGEVAKAVEYFLSVGRDGSVKTVQAMTCTTRATHNFLTLATTIQLDTFLRMLPLLLLPSQE